ncbi:mRNA-capping enzyme subunit beta [Verticillium dahliae VdLs.17]|uniref:mRNA-capping enzyme subunit beta n=2 Tax=Verticillium dahliae TaxID=27337 RepID=G2X9B0_VERDV|nr:mRNA-capping enzyme subunit beta [Verticillium dahliae VdLs.17]KAF3342597.1 hypothetical protein VdG2_09557 [Verticillium dahliae VDG2]KAH6687650.1 mRNA-capping enzyme subunit beta [Verticillium dahliae]EGY15578.1 mRNA-capping enzyme subunit beta [Verticillium dahliae VdLs.17]PNH36020.1 hypothetical protein BJF96_g938 [Verticillium dahliae]PNH50146.1 hypothetical protein VD0003_g7027 [Verticillium dahliae]
MDLRSLMNTNDDGERTEKPAPHGPPKQQQQQQPPPHPHYAQQQQQQQQQQHHPQQHPQQQQPPSAQTPTTPAQGPTAFAFRESAYSHALHSSPGKPSAPQEYSVHGQAGPGPGPNSGSYPPQSPYQTPGPYPNRPPQPTLQTQYSDPRSPGGAPMPGPSPYRHTPSSSVSAPTQGYPFPPSGPAHGSPESTASPVQRHQYPPSTTYPSRDGYSHMSGPPHGATGPPPAHPSGPYAPHQQQPQQQQQQQQQLPQQQQHSMPQTPPIGTSSGHAFIHQRSQSTHSTPTPTSAQSQHQYGHPYPHNSPVATNRPHPAEHNRQPSQPPTPLGPPLSAGQRQSSAAPSYPHPSSPYQQRMSTASSHISQSHATPPPPPPTAIPRAPSSHSAYDPRVNDAHRRSQSNSERERSVSISPKTRMPSLPSSTGGPPSAPPSTIADTEMRPVQPSVASMMDPERERATTPAKRKLADRDLSPREMEKAGTRPPPPGHVNGDRAPPSRSSTRPPTASPQALQKKRARHMTPPVWAQRWDSRENRRLNKANYELQKRGPPSTNGKPPVVVKQEQIKQDLASRHASPEAVRSDSLKGAPVADHNPNNEIVAILGPWEPSITGVKPTDEIAKNVADFLYLNVVANPDSGEIANRGVEFEIEAKLGTLIDKDTNERVEKFVTTACLLHDTGRIAFRSSMTAAQHKGMNQWLNDKVLNTNPQNPDPRVRDRVQVQYKHRREVDKFFEIPSQLQGRLPGCVRARINPKHSVKVRVTYDQKTGEPLAKIVKARVADINLHMPNAPLDCRISINLEAAWDGPIEELEQIAVGHGNKFPDRSKDRLSYTQSHYQVDLTQVTQTVPGPGNTQRVDKEHELEIELAPHVTIDQGQRATSGQPHKYPELIEGFVDNIRILARAAGDFV